MQSNDLDNAWRLSHYVLLVFITMIACDKQESSIAAIWQAASRDAEQLFLVPEELDATGDFFKTALSRLKQRMALAELGKAAEDVGLSSKLVSVGQSKVVVFFDMPGKNWGRGFYAFNEAFQHPLLIQAPHGFHDKYTGDIALSLMLEHGAAAVALNTAHRSLVDLADEDDTPFQQLTSSFAKVFPEGTIVQMHGFSREKRRTGAGKQADIILSNGTARPPAWLLVVARGLSDEFGSGVVLYPHQVSELGGTKNSQGELLRREHYQRFIHVELSLALRKALLGSETLRRRFIRWFLPGKGK